MSRKNSYYYSLMQSMEWRRLRNWYISNHPYCEVCESQGLAMFAREVHHKVPVEKTFNHEEMRQRCMDVDNLQALCHPCHAQIHQEMRSHTHAEQKRRQREQTKAFINRYLRSDG